MKTPKKEEEKTGKTDLKTSLSSMRITMQKMYFVTDQAKYKLQSTEFGNNKKIQLRNGEWRKFGIGPSSYEQLWQ